MITAAITNITADGQRLRAFIRLSNGVDESFLMPTDATAANIRTWADERAQYHQDLSDRAALLKQEVVGE